MLDYTQDKKRLYEFFQKDPVLFAYHIGDLDDFHFEHCQWTVTYGHLPYIEEAILLYTGLKIPTLLAFGLGDKFGDLLREMVDLLPETFHCHFQPRYRDLFLSQYDAAPLGTHWKMKLGIFQPSRETAAPGSIVHLNSSHEVALLSLYDRAYPDNYFNRRMLETGKYLGYIEDNSILAVAGVHVDSDEYHVAVLGNITTDPAHRGRGLATLVTSQLVAELTQEGKMVCLNVKADNAPAIACYGKLGFVKVHQYEEALFTMKRTRA